MNKILHYCDCYPEYIRKEPFQNIRNKMVLRGDRRFGEYDWSIGLQVLHSWSLRFFYHGAFQKR